MTKIPSFPALTAPSDADLLVIEDSVSASTKKITRDNFLSGSPLPADTVDAQAIAANSVTTAKILNDNVTAAKLADDSVFPANLTAGLSGSSWAGQSWTPTLSGRFTDGDWTKACKSIQVGKTVHYRLFLTASDATPMGGGSSNGIFTLPVTSISYGTASRQSIGQGVFVDDSGLTYPATALWTSTTTAIVYFQAVSGTSIVLNGIDSGAPFTWTTNDVVYIQGWFEAA